MFHYYVIRVTTGLIRQIVESVFRAVLQWKMLSPDRQGDSSGATPRTKNRRRFGPCGAAFLLMASAANLPCTESKICVETDIDIFLCTDDMATARQRAMRRNDEPLRFAGLGLDLGVEQRNDGQPHQQKKISEHITKVKEYFETVVLAEQKYDDVRDRW